ncbi:hypothetical protein G9A89_012794 [Geosiphon pyriformis]|nr:hypothetical protein G9A89_012794 [Geosiphon pyriformis]
MKQLSLSASGSGSVSAGLGSWSGEKKKAHVKSIYSYSFLFKKPKKPKTSGVVVDLSARSLSANTFEMDSEKNSVSEVLNMKNIKNTVTEEMSYIDFNTSEMDNMIDDTTLRKT